MTKGEATRTRIIEMAAPLFNQRGYEGCSMQEIMMATGLEKGSIYRYFESKEALAVAAFEYACSLSLKIRTSDLDHIRGSLEKIRFCIHRFVTTPSTLPGGCPMLNAAVDSDDGSLPLRKVVRGAFGDWKKRLCALLEQGITEGEVLPDTKPVMIVDMIIASLEGAYVLCRVQGERSPLKHVETLLNQMLDSIKVPVA
jgi:TetR/AcrR family transcriptional regulator, transcriptional repressor for nem operon